ncbi:Glycoside hydrolase [Parasponia andersonii]|uniref:glucan endo-1,3-beta-D-glucosidase n=1 Tax=Parasponia andersonii TaxID=3476 RepID=A0A2P5D0D6_PARAD|nr:Glycoside hydrolase [Parasponia andersonii]
MLTMGFFIFPIFFFCFLGLTCAGQESVQLLNLYTTTPEVPQTASSHSIAVSVSGGDLHEVSSSVLVAERWLRTNVLAHYPASRVTTIVVGNTVLCQKGQEHKLSLVLPSLKNIHQSLTRWGLEKDIKVSATFSSDCLHPESTYFNGDFAKRFTKPLMEFLQVTNSTYSLNPPPKFSPLPAETMSLVSSHSECMKKLGLFGLNKVNVIVNTPKDIKPMTRKLSSVNPGMIDPFPARPYPLPGIADSPPLHSSVGYSVPAHVAKPPIPTQAQISSPPQISPQQAQIASPHHISFPSSAPEIPPVFEPASPPFGFTLPPCDPSAFHPGAPAPQIAMVHKLWCVAKPTVPADTLQAAMDYACGDGGADCDEIMPHGNCYNPDTVVAHASYAFNSYWQRHKRNGGTCSFGGTAMLINNDPSFLHCRFVLT